MQQRIVYLYDIIKPKKCKGIFYNVAKFMSINVTGGVISDEERDAYVRYITEKHCDKKITGIDISLDGDYVDLKYHFVPKDFERIRRITGYLVGTLDNWNNGKRAEEHDRVKHDVLVTEQI